ncbi:hypothetical protein CAL7102_03473 [Dulcicalothrix desertica PCC 7102]|nr:hypothetical protein CAL7102_03473 [Dulcicalothrix desertica PCC 7102]
MSANLILNDLVDQNLSIIDQSYSWSKQDVIDVTNFSLQYAATIFPKTKGMSVVTIFIFSKQETRFLLHLVPPLLRGVRGD